MLGVLALIIDVLETIYYLLPALVANAAPVLLHGGHPIDRGLKLKDGRRFLGDGKTFEGILIGVLCGIFVGGIETLFGLPIQFVSIGLALAVGALLGDVAGAFIKRRLDMERGAPAPLLDQLDFLLGAYLVAGLWSYASSNEFEVFGNILSTSVQMHIILTSLYLVPLLHVATNTGAYYLGFKPHPW